MQTSIILSINVISKKYLLWFSLLLLLHTTCIDYFFFAQKKIEKKKTCVRLYCMFGFCFSLHFSLFFLSLSRKNTFFVPINISFVYICMPFENGIEQNSNIKIINYYYHSDWMKEQHIQSIYVYWKKKIKKSEKIVNRDNLRHCAYVYIGIKFTVLLTLHLRQCYIQLAQPIAHFDLDLYCTDDPLKSIRMISSFFSFRSIWNRRLGISKNVFQAMVVNFEKKRDRV